MYKALIIDDEKSSRLLIAKLGRWNEFGIEQPFTASNGEDGLSMIRDLHPNIVFVDMQMPIMDGNEFLKLASVNYPTIKYIVVSGHDEFPYVKTALQTRAIDYLLKPISSKELNDVIALAVSELDHETGQVHAVIQNESYKTDEIPELIKKYLDENYTTEINLQDMSDKYYFTKEYLSKLFKKSYGIGIYEYILSLRMNRAKELLLRDDMQIQQISELLGYSNSNYFSKAFKTYFSISPSDFREDNLKKQ
jgi:Response regulator containing CheY-like receiver domain and AraC-type DNA-binding domain